MRQHIAILVLFAAAAAIADGPGRAADWPQLQRDPQHSGRTEENIFPPMKSVWGREFNAEFFAGVVQPIVVAGKVYVGTKSGILHCVNAESGADIWEAQVGAPIMHTAAVAQNRVFVGSLRGVHAVDAATGDALWSHKHIKGFTAAPLAAEDAVFIGSRDGVFFRLAQATGEVVWQRNLGQRIFQTAAYENGRIYIGTEDARMHCLDAQSGKVLWTSEQLWGNGFLSYYPLVHKGKIMVRTMPATCVFPLFYPKIEQFLELIRRETGLEAAWGYSKVLSAEEAQKTGKTVASVLDQYPPLRDVFVLDVETGAQSYCPPFWYAVCNGGVCQPYVVGPDGMCYGGAKYVPFPHGTMTGGMGRFDIETGTMLELMVQQNSVVGFDGKLMGRPQHDYRHGWIEFTDDEDTLFSFAGDYMIAVRWGNTPGWLDVRTRKNGTFDHVLRLVDGEGRATKAPMAGFIKAPNTNSMPGGHAPSVSNGRVFYIVSNRLMAWESMGREREGGKP